MHTMTRPSATSIGVLGFRTAGDLATFIDTAPRGGPPIRVGSFASWRQLTEQTMRSDALRCALFKDLPALSALSDNRNPNLDARYSVFALHYDALRSAIDPNGQIDTLSKLAPGMGVLHLQYPWPSVAVLRKIRADHPTLTVALHVRIRGVLDQKPDRLVRALADYDLGSPMAAFDELLIDAAPVAGADLSQENFTRPLDLPMVEALLTAVGDAYPMLPLGLMGRIPSGRVKELVPLMRRRIVNCIVRDAAPHAVCLRVIADLSPMAAVDEPFPVEEGHAFVQAVFEANNEAWAS